METPTIAVNVGIAFVITHQKLKGEIIFIIIHKNSDFGQVA
jgi:hypothetical protein